MLKFQKIIVSFFHFVRNPNAPVYPTISPKQKLIDVCFYFLFVQFIVGGIILWYPVAFAEKIGLFNTLASKKQDEDVLLTVVSAIIIAPLIEEWLFRFPLGENRNKPYFKWLYYGVSIVFGLVHIFIYNIDSTHLPYIPFITMTQTFSGFLFGYIRIVYGFGYGILLHSLFNTLGVIWEYTIGFSL